MEKWLRDKHREVVAQTNIIVNKAISPDELSNRMAEFGGHFSFAVSEAVEADRDFKLESLAWEEWYASKLNEVVRGFQGKGTQKIFDAAIMEQWPEEYNAGRERLIEKEAVKKMYDHYVRVWAGIKDIYIELARTLRGERFGQDIDVRQTGISQADIKTTQFRKAKQPAKRATKSTTTKGKG